MVKLTIDDREIEVAEGTTVLAAAKKHGIEIPHLCYHNKLSAAGNCRLCLVEVDGMDDLVISCREAVREGMTVRTDTDAARKARADMLELILINHPLDCPVCDKSGECELQDCYFDHSLRPSRFSEEKIRKRKATKIGRHIYLDSERCIGCTRCIRFFEEVIGVHELGIYKRGAESEIGVAPESEFNNPYSMCAVDVCPVGALTAADFRFKKRAWLLESVSSICTGCSTGCKAWVDHADKIVYRYRPHEDESGRGGLLCDPGRMSYEMINSSDRVMHPLILERGEMFHVTWDDAAMKVRGIARGDVENRIAVLSARSSIEENESFMRMCRNFLGVNKFNFSGNDPEPAFADKILKDSDRNPNTKGVSAMVEGRFGEAADGAGWVILDGLSRDELLTLVDSNPSWVMLVTSNMNKGQRIADVVLPKPSHVEQNGTFINRYGVSQIASMAFEPLGESRCVWDIEEMIGKVMENEVSDGTDDPSSGV